MTANLLTLLKLIGLKQLVKRAQLLTQLLKNFSSVFMF